MDAAKARNFAIRWEGRGQENRDTIVFWTEFFQRVLDVPDVYGFAEFEKPVRIPGQYNGPAIKVQVHQGQSQIELEEKPSKRKSTKKAIDVYIPSSKIIIEQKSLGRSLDARYCQSDGEWLTPIEQAVRYNNGLRSSEKARYIVTCNFDEFRIYDLDYPSDLFFSEFVTIKLAELQKHVGKFDFMVRPHKEELIQEKDLSVKAAYLMAKLRDRLERQYELYGLNRSHLTVLMVRLLFCLYAEDSTLFERNQFRNYLADKIPDQQLATFKIALDSLFEVLNTSPEDRGLVSGELSAFPYVNGGLFAGKINIPFFDEETKRILLDECCPFQWSEVSPALFGSLFESVLSLEERHDGGMHYTSIENIRKVTHPLFLDELELKLRKAGNNRAKLRELQGEISGIRLLDPACGSGNFLTQSYIDLRRLENRILERLVDPKGTGQSALQVDATVSSKVQIDHFHGIEINDFAVHVAETAMQIAKHQMDIETSAILNRRIETLPLTKDTSIVEANALTTNWNDILPASECSFVVGNPPFLGARYQTKQQKTELMGALGRAKNSGNVDYVAGWFHKAAGYIDTFPIRCAFVATNSICQGDHVANMWKPLWDSGIRIDFAYDTFRWTNDADKSANVFVVVVGFSRLKAEKRLFQHESPDAKAIEILPKNINAYLMDAPDVFLSPRKTPICAAPLMGIGNKPIDGGNYLFTEEEMSDFLKKEPGAKEFFHKWYGAKEFISGKPRWCLRLRNVPFSQLRDLQECRKRIDAVRQYRLSSKNAQTRKLADEPTRFHVENIPDGTSILIPQTSSQRRLYIPIGFLDRGDLCSNAVRIIPNGTIYEFGVLQSRAHNAWVRRVSGRLKNDYQYSESLAYNCFPWPGAERTNKVKVDGLIAEKERSNIEEAARRILDARERYMNESNCTLEDLYEPKNIGLFPALTRAHRELDEAVEVAYGIKSEETEDGLVEHLLSMYRELEG